MAHPGKLPAVPSELAQLYAFANSLDLRRFVEDGAPHSSSDKLATVAALEGWLRSRGLLAQGGKLGRSDHRKALALRDALRGFLALAPQARRDDRHAALLNAAAAHFPLVVHVAQDGAVELQPLGGSSRGLGRILAELARAAQRGDLDRLKMCASDECHWVFYDRSKPATRRWCSSTLCGNRQKTRAYRARQRHEASA